MFTLDSRDLTMWFSITSLSQGCQIGFHSRRWWTNRVKFCILSWPCSLGDKRSRWQTLDREQNERDFLEALGEYKGDAEMSLENGPAVVNIKTLKGRFIAPQVLHWVGDGRGEECGKEKECCWPGCSQVQFRNVLLDSKTKKARLRGTQVLGTSCCCERVNTEKQ